MLVINLISNQTRKREKERERQISEINMTLGKYGQWNRRNIQYKKKENL